MKKLLLLLLLSISLTSSVYADFDDGLRAAQNGDFETAYKEWQPLAEQGHANAQFALGYMYFIGDGVPQDDEQAIYWHKKAAEQGHIGAQQALDEMLKTQQ